MKGKITFLQVLILLIGVILGNFIAEITKGIGFLSWLSYGQTFGISPSSPFHLDLGVFQFSLGLSFHFTIASIIGLVIAIIIIKKTR